MKISCGDIQNAYLQGLEVDRLILYRIPKGGIPGEDVPDGTVIAARVPIYGTEDAGRGFWLKPHIDYSSQLNCNTTTDSIPLYNNTDVFNVTKTNNLFRSVEFQVRRKEST